MKSDFRSELAGKNDNLSFTWSKFMFKHGNLYYTLPKYIMYKENYLKIHFRTKKTLEKNTSSISV